MKKHLIAILILTITLGLFLMSCDVADKGSKEEASQDIFLLDFEVLNGSKGMTLLPEGVPFLEYDLGEGLNPETYAQYVPWVSAQILSSLPLIPSFTLQNEKPSVVLSNLKEGNFTCYGIPLKITNGKVNSDGIFLKYTGYEGEKEVVSIDYYYSWETQRFSYREVVAAFMQNTYGIGDNVIVFQMYDVPIKMVNGKPAFRAKRDKGDFNQTRILLRNSLMPGDHGYSDYVGKLSLMDYSQAINFSNGTIASAAYVFNQVEKLPFNTISNGKETLQDFMNNEENKTKYGFTYSEALGPDLSNDGCNLDFTKEVMKFAYDGDMVEAIWSSTPTSFEEFNSMKYEFTPGVKNLLSSSETPFRTNRWDVVGGTYCDNVNKKAAAIFPTNTFYNPGEPTAETKLTNFVEYTFKELFLDVYKESNFASAEAFAKRHLELCGLDKDTLMAFNLGAEITL